DAERASGSGDVGAAGDHRLQRLAAAAGEQQLEVEVVLAENAGALAQRGRSPVPYFALPNRNLELVCGEGGDGCEPSRYGGGETNPDSMDHGGPHCAPGICAWGKLTPAAPAAKAAHPRPMEKPRSSRSVGQEFQGHAVDAVAQPRGRRAVLEDMAQMSAAAPAMHLGTWQQQQVVGGGADRVRQRPIEARPAGLAVVFGFRREQRKIAARAGKRAFALLVVERARARGLGAVPTQDVVLRLAEDGSPFAVALLD